MFEKCRVYILYLPPRLLIGKLQLEHHHHHHHYPSAADQSTSNNGEHLVSAYGRFDRKSVLCQAAVTGHPTRRPANVHKLAPWAARSPSVDSYFVVKVLKH